MQLQNPSQTQPPTASVVSPERLALMVGKIACIIFVIEALVMLALYGYAGNAVTVTESMLDSTMLTLFASPLIYLWVARPFAEEAAVARESLAMQLFETKSLLDQNVQLKDSLQEFTAASADIHEKTLQRIGADLHDGAAQTLTYSLLQVDRLLRALDRSGQAHLVTIVNELRTVLFETSREVRGISTGLALPELRTMPLQDVVDLAVRRHRNTSGRSVEVTFQSSAQPTQSHKSCIYRIVQEALTNASKHGNAQILKVSVANRPALTVTVSDDGRGFVPGDVVNRGLGLLGMRVRVEALRGRFSINSKPDGGTIISAEFDDPSMLPGEHHGV